MAINKGLIGKIKSGMVGVLLTDTIYGLVGQALSKKAVAKVYRLKRRNPKKPFIILISSYQDLFSFGIKPDSAAKKILQYLWPGKVSVIMPCKLKKFKYLHRGTSKLAFRFPKKPNLIQIIRKAGPLVAPSANPEGFPPANTIKQAKKYFGNQVDFYINGGKLKSLPSTIVEINRGKAIVKRKGAVKI